MIKLGIIGLSEGNGHPYSWSAIFNGYDKKKMEHCGYPVIPEYLSKESFPACQISGAKVTHIWTQDIILSEKIARTVYIDNVCETLEELIQGVDAILLARDDWYSHKNFAEMILKSGKPLYIDKPVALSLNDLEQIYSYQKYKGQIFTCSALRFANEFKLSKSELADLGEITYILAKTPKDWEKYSVHIIEPVLNIIQSKIVSCYKTTLNKMTKVDVVWENGVNSTFVTTMNSVHGIEIEIIGSKQTKRLAFIDTYSAFKNALQQFINNVIESSKNCELDRQRLIVQVIEKGLE